jgi:putative membrane-bound dehydrogenase-like protein
MRFPALPSLLAAGFLGSPLMAGVVSLAPHAFTVPDGFTILRATTTNEVLRPVNACFDDRGRLYVTDSGGSSAPPAKQHEDPQWRVVRLEDTDGDGAFDRSEVFADRLPYLQGILWHSGTVYVGGTPAIWKLIDADGDGRAEQRIEWWNVGHAPTHCGNEVHGPFAGPDGFIYWTKGAFEPVSWTNGLTGRVHRDRAAHIFRARPDGSAFEAVMTGGMDNPVEVAFTPEGECVFTSTFIDFSEPGFRDGLGHARWGAVFGKQNSVLDDRAIRRADIGLTHPFAQFGASAPSGLCRYEGSALGRDFTDNLFVAHFNLRKVSRHTLRADGATYAATSSDFVVSDQTDFHPTDVLADADGSLLIVDTGGWYKLCCPSSQLWKADVLGAIYRVRPANAAPLRAGRKAAAQAALANQPSVQDYRIETVVARAADRSDPRNAAWFRNLISLRADREVTVENTRLLAASVRGLGRVRDAESIPALFALAEKRAATNLALRDAIVATLIEINAPDATRAGLTRTPAAQRAALIALDQMPGGGLSVADVTPLLLASDPAVAAAALWVAGRHGDWGSGLADFLRARLRTPDLALADRQRLENLLGDLAGDSAVQAIIAEAVGELAQGVEATAGFTRGTRRHALEVIAANEGTHPPESWHHAVLTLLTPTDHGGSRPDIDATTFGQVIQAAARLAVATNVPTNFAAVLLSTARATQLVPAFAAVPSGWSAEDTDVQRLGLALETRVQSLAAATALSRAVLTPGQLGQLTAFLTNAGPLELQRLVPAFERGGDEPLGAKLVAALRDARSRAALQPAVLRGALKNFPEPVRRDGDQLLASLNVDAAAQEQRLTNLLSTLPKGEIRAGQSVFNSARAACSTCHRIGYQGGDVGPDLTKIGEVRTERDLLEAIVFPSATLVRSYEPVTLITRTGDEFTGIARRDDDRGVQLVLGPGSIMEIPRTDITETRPSTVSIMPGGLDEQLTRQELADLVAFLKNTRWGAN